MISLQHTRRRRTPAQAQQFSRQAGLTLFEIALTLGIMATASVGFGLAINRNSDSIRLAGAAAQIATLRAAADRYVQDNFSTLATSAASGPIAISVSTLQSGNYLPPSFSTTNSWGQTYRIYLHKRSNTVLESLVTTTGGTAFSLSQGGTIAQLLKASGGFVPEGSSTARGTRGGWTATLATFVPSGSPTPSGDPAAYSIHYPVYGPTGALIRYATGNAVDNQMQTAIDMNGNNINNAANVNAKSVFASTAGTDPSITAMTPNNGTTGGIRLGANATTGTGYLQVVDSNISSQYGVAAITSDGKWTWSGAINAADLLINGQRVIPSGVVVAFEGACPTGWTAYANAKDRVLVGAGNQYASGQTGGADWLTLTINQMPSHNHKNGISDNNSNEIFVYGSTAATPYKYGVEGEPNYTGKYQGYTETVGGDQAFDNRQAYLALNYCKKN